MTGGPGDRRAAAALARRTRMRQRLIEAAILVVAAHGPEAVVIDDVVTRAGVSRGTFYHYFKSVEELLGAAKEALGSEIVTLVITAAGGMDDPASRIAHALAWFIDLAQRYPLFLEFTARLGTRSLGAGMLVHDMMPEFLAEGAARNRFEPLHSAIAVDIIGGGTLALLQRMLRGEPVDIPAFVAAILRMLGIPTAEAARIAAIPVEPLVVPPESLLARSETLRAQNGPR